MWDEITYNALKMNLLKWCKEEETKVALYCKIMKYYQI